MTTKTAAKKAAAKPVVLTLDEQEAAVWAEIQTQQVTVDAARAEVAKQEGVLAELEVRLAAAQDAIRVDAAA